MFITNFDNHSYLYIAIGSTTVFTFGAGSGPIHMDNVACTGVESMLAQCPYDSHTRDCSHSEDAGVHCLLTRKFVHSFTSRETYHTCIVQCTSLAHNSGIILCQGFVL